ncbi:MAG: protoheme IX farnesyltransferase [Bdellovibrionales bacterium]|nr:protoheme IX farnesyltransferase [Bdellovibrionales bacterium]
MKTQIRLRIYQELSKSGIVALVLISVLAGYLTGHPFEESFSIARLIVTLVAVLLLASGSSAMNQIQEIETDRAMPRTAKRPLPSGRISFWEAMIFSLGSMAAGAFLLFRLDVALFWQGLAAILSYNVLYTMWWKRRFPMAAIPGAIPGALPILMGFTAASRNPWHPGGWFLFLILFFWQMPHFWVLAIRYAEDYRKGGIPTLPVAHGDRITLKQIMAWCLAYVGVAFSGPLFLGTGKIYLVVCAATSLMLVYELVKLFQNSHSVSDPKSKTWLRFFLWVNFSLIFYLAAAVVDLWSVYLIPLVTQ